MREWCENDTYRVPQHRSIPVTLEEIANVQAEIEKSFAEADAIRTQIGLPPLDAAYRISRYKKLHLPVPEHYQQNT